MGLQFAVQILFFTSRSTHVKLSAIYTETLNFLFNLRLHRNSLPQSSFNHYLGKTTIEYERHKNWLVQFQRRLNKKSKLVNNSKGIVLLPRRQWHKYRKKYLVLQLKITKPPSSFFISNIINPIIRSKKPDHDNYFSSYYSLYLYFFTQVLVIHFSLLFQLIIIARTYDGRWYECNYRSSSKLTL